MNRFSPTDRILLFVFLPTCGISRFRCWRNKRHFMVCLLAVVLRHPPGPPSSMLGPTEPRKRKASFISGGPLHSMGTRIPTLNVGGRGEDNQGTPCKASFISPTPVPREMFFFNFQRTCRDTCSTNIESPMCVTCPTLWYLSYKALPAPQCAP